MYFQLGRALLRPQIAIGRHLLDVQLIGWLRCIAHCHSNCEVLLRVHDLLLDSGGRPV